MKKICICGKEFESKTGKARYCSQKCRFKGYYQTHKSYGISIALKMKIK